MKVVVTGGSGQLGSLVLRRLIDDRAVVAVRSLDLRPPIVLSSKLEYVKADVRDEGVGSLLEGFDALIHMAFVVTELDKELSHSVNVEGSRNMFEAAARAELRRLVYCSSIAAYGVMHGHDLPLREDSPRRKQTDFTYAETRFAVEEDLDRFEEEHPEVEVIRLRPGVMIGPRMSHPYGAALFRHFLIDAEGAPTPVVWDADAADAVMLALKREGMSGAFNLVAEEPVPPYEISRLTGVRIVRVPRGLAVALSKISSLVSLAAGLPSVDPAWVRVTDVPMNASCERARKVLGWHPDEPTSRGVWLRFARTVPFRLDRRIRDFFAVVNEVGRQRTARGLEGHDARILVALTGRKGGDFTLRVDDGRFSVREAIPRPPTSSLTLDADHFLRVLRGRANLRSLHATGRMRVEGDDGAVGIVTELIHTWRRELESHPRAAGSRWLERWMSRVESRRSSARA